MALFGNSESHLASIENKLDLIIRHLGIGPSDEDLAEVRRLHESGQKIDAIKLYRRHTGAGLAEAKRAVENM
ncbi:MAG: hypothetical protein ACR2P0_04880 [Acidimicrobiales bacterium]